jgi:hypothetical protein
MLTRRLFSNYYKNKAIAPQRAKPDRLSPQIKQRSLPSPPTTPIACFLK